ncbi:MAG TPA: response regulator transcription factor [Candidatus Dormibacteraeota bacterium]
MAVQWKIALVEDDTRLSRAISEALRTHGYRVRGAGSAADGVQLISDWNPDLVLVDLMLPDNDGPELFGSLRDVSNAALVGMSARSRLGDVVAGLGAGADDYIVKPFAMEELIARIDAILRRTQSHGVDRITLADLVIDVSGGSATRGARRLELTATEFRLLVVLGRNAGKVLSQDQLLNQVWSLGSGPESNAVEVHIARLRRKLESGGEPRLLHTVRGMGVCAQERGGLREVRRILVAAALAASAAVAGVTPTAAYNSWCEDEPPVTVVTPGGQHVTINNWISVPVQDRHLLRKVHVYGEAVPGADPDTTLVTVHVITPRGGSNTVRITSSTQRFDQRDYEEGGWGSEIILKVTIPVS